MQPSDTAIDVKQRLEGKLGIPTVLQRILDGSEEIADAVVVARESVTLLWRDLPKVTTEDFLRSMVGRVSSWQDGMTSTGTKLGPPGKRSSWNGRCSIAE